MRSPCSREPRDNPDRRQPRRRDVTIRLRATRPQGARPSRAIAPCPFEAEGARTRHWIRRRKGANVPRESARRQPRTREDIMFRMFGTAFGALALALAAGRAPAQQLPEGYPADYQAVVDAARKEGVVTIYATTDSAAAAPLIKDFEAAFPGIKIEYSDLNSTELYNRFISEAAAGGSADLLWSGAPDLQIKLAADGYAMAYASPELKSIPSWAAWRDQAYGTTFEPMVMVYNKRLVPAEDVPA